MTDGYGDAPSEATEGLDGGDVDSKDWFETETLAGKYYYQRAQRRATQRSEMQRLKGKIDTYTRLQLIVTGVFILATILIREPLWLSYMLSGAALVTTWYAGYYHGRVQQLERTADVINHYQGG